jgi:hypothetical protein
MRPLRGVVWGCALMLLGVGTAPVQGSWCNVFQVCCFGCRRPAAVSYYAPVAAPAPCCNACPQTCCSTSYVQRCYYQPVTTYQSRTYYEPVTTYHTSYYCEPVCSYRYSCYFDPCSCSYQQVAIPTTSYVMRSQCTPVQSWVQRCCSVPVTTYQQSFYYEPVTTCTTTPSCCPAPAPCCPTAAAAAVPSAPAPDCPPGVAAPVAPQAPGVMEQRQAPPPAVREYQNGAPIQPLPNERYYRGADQMPPASYRGVAPQSPNLFRPTSPAGAPPAVRLDRIVVLPDAQSRSTGAVQLVRR